MATVSTGYFPIDVSSESMTASVPSRMAFATSVTSARVGRMLSVIETSICVAVITGRPKMFAIWMICFCTAGTSSIGVWTPRSPRAIITPSVSRRISSMFASASCRSIFAITRMVFPAWAACSRARRISSARSMNDIPNVSIPSERPKSMHSRSRLVTALSATIPPPPTRLTPLRESTVPPAMTVALTSFPVIVSALSWRNPSLM